jgi:hypothetical protein
MPLKHPKKRDSEALQLDIWHPVFGAWKIVIVFVVPLYWRGGFNAGAQLQKRLKFGPFVEALSLNTLLIAFEDAAAHVGVKRGELDAKQVAGFIPIQVCFSVQFYHLAVVPIASSNLKIMRLVTPQS